MDFDLQATLLAYERTLRSDPHNVPALCEIGKALNQLKRPQEARKCYKAAVEAFKRAIRTGDAEAALSMETSIYIAFVRTVEDENHYYRCFSDWRDDMAKLGRRFRNEQPAAGNANRIAFYLHTGFMLGHTEVMFKMLENIPRERRENLVLRIYVLTKFDQMFLDRAQKIGVEVVLLATCVPGGHSSRWVDRYCYLRDHLRHDGMGVCIWVSSPDLAAFALSMRLAPVQIFWALRFHAIAGPFIDGYITYGAKHDLTQVFGKQEWRVCPVPLAIDASPVADVAQAELRAYFPEKFLLGTLAREDKINSAPFLACVAKILQQNPAAGFIWTGQSRHAGIERYFHEAGVGERCHFAGWVDTRLYASTLDLFLETFPLGCGITGYQALGAATPLLSYFAPNTVFGMQFWHEFPGTAASGRAVSDDVLSKYPVLCAKDAEHYVALAHRLIDDPAFRGAVGAAGKRFFDDEIGNAGYYSGRFLDTIAEIARTTLGARSNATTSTSS